jgi:carboxymethylenebutenolidase
MLPRSARIENHMKLLLSTTAFTALLAISSCHSVGEASHGQVADSKTASTATAVEADVHVEVQAGDSKPTSAHAVPATSITEEEFKALHKPPSNVAPPRHGEMIEIDGTRAYLSLPAEAKTPMPGVVVIHEWWGLNENIMYWADRLAAEGYAAIAVDLYGGIVATDTDTAYSAMNAVDPVRAVHTMVAAEEFLRTSPRILAPRTASIGWCFGGSQSLQLALASPELDAAVVYYGNPIVDAAKLAPMHAELLGIFGTRDRSIPPEKVAAFEKALAAANKTATIRSFDAEHAFANPSSARYDEGAAAEAWTIVRAFLKSKLAAPAR